MSERTSERGKELDRFEADIAAVAAENAAGGKKNGKASEKLPAITAHDATESKVSAIVDAVTVKGTDIINKCRAQLDALEQELLTSAQRQKVGLVNHISLGMEVEQTAESVSQIVQNIRAKHAKVVGA